MWTNNTETNLKKKSDIVIIYFLSYRVCSAYIVVHFSVISRLLAIALQAARLNICQVHLEHLRLKPHSIGQVS